MSPEATTRFEPSQLVGRRDPLTDDRTEQARTAGYAAGWAAGARAAAEHAAEQRRQISADNDEVRSERAADHAALVAALQRACVMASARTAPVLAEAQHALQTAALELAEVLLGVELADGERSARAALHRALSLPAEVGPLTVRLHPRDAQIIHTAVADGELNLPDDVIVRGDPNLAAGDAISVHEDGYLDARIATAVARVRDVLSEEAL